MTDVPGTIYTNKSATVIITPPAFPLQKADIAWCRAERIEELEESIEDLVESLEHVTADFNNAHSDKVAAEAKLEEVFQMYVDANEFRLELEAKLGRAVDALEKLARLGNGEKYGNSDGNMIARTALAGLKGQTDE